MDSNKPQVTIVVPVYNRADLVSRTLDSIAAQTARPLAVVLVDNNSTDGTRGVLDEWAARTRGADFDVAVVTATRPGASAARNRGLAEVTTPWVMFFDSDDTMRPDHVARALKGIDSHPHADIIGWPVLFHGVDGSTRVDRFPVGDLLFDNITHSTLSTLRYMVRTDLVRRVGGWLEEASMMDDAELGTRMLVAGARVVRDSDRITVDVYESPRSISNDSIGRIATVRPALDSMRRHLPPYATHWPDLLEVLLTGSWARRDPASPARAAELIRRQPLGRRLLFAMLYRYVRLGGRGAARIYRLITALKLPFSNR